MRMCELSPLERLAAAVVLAGTAALGSGQAAADASADVAACGAAVGTYVTSVSDREGVFSSRGLMTLTGDGIVLMADSAQGGVPGIWDPFTGSQGSWKCAGADGEKLQLKAVALNFVVPGDGRTSAFGRVDYQASFDVKSGELSGKATLSFFAGQDLESHNPASGPGKLVDEFQFDAHRVTVSD